MTDKTITDIQNKHRVSAKAAALIYEAYLKNSSEFPLKDIISIYKLGQRRRNRELTGFELYSDISAQIAHRIQVKKKIGTKDDHSTRFVKHSFTADKNEQEFYGGIRDKDRPKDWSPSVKITDEGKLITPPRYVPTRGLLQSEEGKEYRVSPREAPIKYYYFDVNRTMNNYGYTQPPDYDRQFKGFYQYIPYAIVQVTWVRTPPRHSVPVIDDITHRVIGHEKATGTKIVNVKLMYNGNMIFDRDYTTAFEKNAEFDGMKSKAIVDAIRSELSKVMQSKQVSHVYDTIANEGKTPHLGDIATFGNPKEQAKRELEMKRAEEFEKYYGKDFESESRKRKSQKPKPKRKITKKPSIKKIVKKCVCNPTQKRKITSIHKKLIKRKIKRK